MKKIIIAPDSFKETMSNIEVASIIYDTLYALYPDYEYKLMPVADGGEGSLNSIVSDVNDLHTIECNNANMEMCSVKYGIVKNNGIVEVAENIGFKYKKPFSNPGNTTSYGVGEVIKELKNQGIKKIYVCLGGTITNDGGCGLASCLGVKFYDSDNKLFVPTGFTLNKIKKIDNSKYLEEYKDVSIIGLCDVTNPLYGKNGASYVYAPQKGANDEDVKVLDEGLKHLEEVVKRDLNIDAQLNPGSGAAGGIGYAIQSFLNGKLKKGIETILSLMDFKKEINDETIIITGEGKLDSQSLQGKVIDGIIKVVKNKKVPVIVITGKVDGNIEEFKNKGISKIIVTNPKNLPFSEVKKKCKEQLKEAIKKLEI